MTDVSLDKIRAAQQKIQALVPATPVKQSIYLGNRTGKKVYLKLENLNISGSFKIRGASNALLSMSKSDLAGGVVAASAGNHAQGVAYACRLLGIKATIFMPLQSSLVKIESTRGLGGDVRLVGDSYDAAYKAALAFQKENGGLYVHAFADPQVINGQGTCGLEMLEQVPDAEVFIIPIGGGGLISGIACAIKSVKPQATIIGVTTSAFPGMAKSFKSGKPEKTGHAYTIADGIAVKEPNQYTIDLIRKYVDHIISIDEPAIASAITDLIERDHIVAEGSGAIAAAALLQLEEKYLKTSPKGSVVCVISGGNIDVNLLSRITIDGQIYSGRMMRISLTISDKPGTLAELLNIIGETGANLLEVRHIRHFGKMSYNDVAVELDLETTNSHHQSEIARILKSKNYLITQIGSVSKG